MVVFAAMYNVTVYMHLVTVYMQNVHFRMYTMHAVSYILLPPPRQNPHGGVWFNEGECMVKVMVLIKSPRHIYTCQPHKP